MANLPREQLGHTNLVVASRIVAAHRQENRRPARAEHANAFCGMPDFDFDGQSADWRHTYFYKGFVETI